jgi:hypothetical protein
MALQIKKGTDAQRRQYTPLLGELLYVTDHIQAGVDPIYVGDGITAGGVAVGQNAVLSGTMEDDIDLNSFNIVGTGNLTFTGNINNTGTTTSKKITITGNSELIGGQTVVVAVDSTGRISHTGNINVSGNITSTGVVQAVTVESDLIGSVISSDSTEILVDANTNQFFGNQITLLDSIAGTSLAVSGSSVIFNSDDPLRPLEFGSPSDPISFSKYDFGPDIRFSKLIIEEDDGVSLAGSTIITTYKGELSDPENIEEHDIVGATFYQSFNGKTTGAGATPAVNGFAGAYGFVAESQTGATPGTILTTFIVGSGENANAVINDDNLNFADNNNDLLKYTSKGVLKIKAIQLRQLNRSQRNELNADLDNGSIVYVTDPTDSGGEPLGNPALQVKVNGAWFNISATLSIDP